MGAAIEETTEEISELDYPLNAERVLKFTDISKDGISLKGRPTQFSEIIYWCRAQLESFARDSLLVVVNPDILINNTFAIFTEMNPAVIVNCVAFESILTGQDEGNADIFTMLGIWKIAIDMEQFNFTFYLMTLPCDNGNEIARCALFIKKDYDKYSTFIKNYLAWKKTLLDKQIKVIGGIDYVCPENKKWSDMLLPPDLKTEIKTLADSFFLSKDKYLKNNIPWKRSLLLYGKPGNGKSAIINTVISEYNVNAVTVVPSVDENQLFEVFSYAEQNAPLVLFFERLDRMINNGYVTAESFDNQFNRIKATDGIFLIATAIDLSKIPVDIIDHPTRFDRKFEIPMPDEKLALQFLKKRFKGCRVSQQLLNEIAELAVKNEFSYSHLQALYLSSCYSALSNRRQLPKVDDINDAVNILLKEKKSVQERFTTTSKKRFGFSKEK